MVPDFSLYCLLQQITNARTAAEKTHKASDEEVYCLNQLNTINKEMESLLSGPQAQQQAPILLQKIKETKKYGDVLLSEGSVMAKLWEGQLDNWLQSYFALGCHYYPKSSTVVNPTNPRARDSKDNKKSTSPVFAKAFDVHLLLEQLMVDFEELSDIESGTDLDGMNVLVVLINVAFEMVPQSDHQHLDRLVFDIAFSKLPDTMRAIYDKMNAADKNTLASLLRFVQQHIKKVHKFSARPSKP